LIDLLSGAVGGVIVFVLSVLWSEVRDGRRRVRACMGYARLLRTELLANYFALSGAPTPMQYEEAVERGKDDLYSPMGKGGQEFVAEAGVVRDTAPERFEHLIQTWQGALSSEAWREVREPLAPLIAHTDFERLDQHYRELDWFLVQLQRYWSKANDRDASASYRRSLADTVRKLQVQMRRLTKDVLPNYTDPPEFKRRFGF
jgi:hypothetical protein